jgi:tetratricopeptide (TPR) repeat protein
LYQKIVAARPDLAEAHANLGVLLFEKQRYGEANEALSQALRRNPALHRARLFLGISQSQLGSYKQAVVNLEKARLAVTEPEFRRLGGLHLHRSYTGLRRYDAAAGLIERLLGEYPRDPDVLYEAARYHSKRSEDALQRLVYAAPDSHRFHQAAAEVHDLKGEYGRAREQYELVLQMRPGLPNVHLRLGQLHLLETDDPTSAQRALAAFEEELRFNPSNAHAHYEIAMLRSKAGHSDEAETRLRRALAIDPDFVEAHLALGALQMNGANVEEAIGHFSAAARLEPENEVAHYRLAQAYRKAGKADLADAEMERFRALRAASTSDRAAFFRAVQRKPNPQTIGPE